MRISSDLRAKIKTGTKSDKGYPKSLDYFNIETFPELVNAYGNKPEKLIVYCPSDNVSDFFFTEYSRWGKALNPDAIGIKMRSCDGETYEDMKTGEFKPCLKCYVNGNVDDKEKCSCYTSFRVFVAGMDGKVISPLPYNFETHSPNSSDNLYSELDKTWRLAKGRLIGIPFVLSVKMVEKLKAGQKRKFPIWHLTSIPNIQMILALSEKAQIPTTDDNRILLDLTQDIPALQSGANEARDDMPKQEIVDPEPSQSENGKKTGYYGYLEQCKHVKDEIKKMTGSTEAYYDVLGSEGLEKSSEVSKTDRERQLKIYKLLNKKLNQLKTDYIQQKLI